MAPFGRRSGGTLVKPILIWVKLTVACSTRPLRTRSR